MASFQAIHVLLTHRYRRQAGSYRGPHFNYKNVIYLNRGPINEPLYE